MEKIKLDFKVQQFTELTDAQWAILKINIDTGRKIKKDLRKVVNYILKTTRTGCQWRNIDEKYGPWCNFYRRLTKDFEKTVESSVAFMQLAFISIILAKFPS